MLTDRFELFTSSVSRIYQSVQKIQRQEMAGYGLKSAHVACLLALQQYPDGITATRLGQFCEKDKAAISRTVAELEQAELICKVAKSGGAYRARLQLTATGRKIAQQVKARTVVAVEQAGAGITDAERNILYATLERIADNLQNICRDGLKEQNAALQEDIK